MKKFVFVLMISVICVMLASCGSAQKKKNASASASENGSGESEQIEEPHWSEKSGPMNWEEAKKHCENNDEKGFTDWRLPNKKELLSIRHGNQSDFGDTETFWTSETIGGEGEMARTVEFRFGRKESYTIETEFFVRCTR